MTNPAIASSTPSLQVTTPGGSFSGFLQWLKSRGSISDYISLLYDFISKPFSSWPTHLQDMYKQYQQSIGATGGGGSGSNLPAPITDYSPVKPVQMHQTVKRAPKGYVTVEYNGQKVYMRRELARTLHLFKPAKKPPISVREWEAAKSWQRVQKKVEKVAKDVDLKTEKRGRSTRRSRPAPRRRTSGEVQEAIIVK